MRYINEDGGRLNNFAVEPKIYQAEPPNKSQQTTFVIMGVAALALVSSLVFVAVSVS